MDEFFRLNPDDFKRWMRKNEDFDSVISPKTIIGMNAETRLSTKRLCKTMIVENGRPAKIAKDFAENGGIIKEVNENEYLIEVSSGSFQINKKYVIV